MDIIVKAARDCAGTVGAAYIAFSLYRLTAWRGHDFYVAPSEKYLGLIACGLFGVLALGYGLARWYETRDERAKRRAASDAERGNVLFLILIAVALFAALSYAVTQTGRTGTGNLDKEKQKLSEAELNSFTAALNQGKMRLRMINGCDSIDYTAPENWVAGDKSCHMFHPEGGGVAYRDFGDTCPFDDMLAALAIGESCDSLLYAGSDGNGRLYTTVADQGTFSWNNGTSNWTETSANSPSDGMANTNTLVGLTNPPDAGAPYEAANACRSLGAEWYLPAMDELNILYENLVDQNGDNTPGGLYGSTFGFNTNWYLSSSESGNRFARSQRFSDGVQGFSDKHMGLSVRCVRR